MCARVLKTMKLLSFISDHLLLCVFLSLLWGTTDSSAANTSTVTAQIVTTTTQKTTLPTSATQSGTSLAPTTTKSPPVNVQNVTVETQSETITLQWKIVSNTDTYISEFNGRKINVTDSADVVIYTVLNLTDGTRYNFSLFTVFDSVRSSGVNYTAETAPRGVNVVNVVRRNESSISLQWNKVNNISEYILQYNDNGSAIVKNISVSQEGPIGYVVSPLTAGTNYSFTLFTVLEGVSSSGYTFNAVTAPCDAGEFRSIDQNETSITLRWKQVSNTDTYIIEFNDRKINIPAPAGVITYTVLDLTHGTRYNFNLFAVFENVRSSGVNYTAVTEKRRDLPPPNASVLRVFCHLVVFCPYCISTGLLCSIYGGRKTANKPAVSMEMTERDEGDDGFDEDYDDAIAYVTTEYNL